jgi:predicted ATPase
MLATIQGYAAEKLARDGDEIGSRRGHAEWALRLARQQVGLPGPNVQRAAIPAELARFRGDYANARSALAWSWAAGADELGLDLGVACCRFWLGEGLFRDATSWLREAMPRIASAAPKSRLRALKVAGLVAFFVLADSEHADAL